MFYVWSVFSNIEHWSDVKRKALPYCYFGTKMWYWFSITSWCQNNSHKTRTIDVFLVQTYCRLFLNDVNSNVTCQLSAGLFVRNMTVVAAIVSRVWYVPPSPCIPVELPRSWFVKVECCNSILCRSLYIYLMVQCDGSHVFYNVDTILWLNGMKKWLSI